MSKPGRIEYKGVFDPNYEWRLWSVGTYDDPVKEMHILSGMYEGYEFREENARICPNGQHAIVSDSGGSE